MAIYVRRTVCGPLKLLRRTGTELIGPPVVAKRREESEDYRVGAGASGDAAVHRVHTRGESNTVMF